MGNLSLRAQDRVVRAALALQRLYALIGNGGGDGSWTWERPDWLDAFPEMTPENLAKANAAQKAADERRRREAEEAAKNPKLHATSGQRRGKLRNGNPAGDYLAAPRCGAHTRSGSCCRQPAMENGLCRMHGGLSTGAHTPEGQARARSTRFVHGFRTAEIIDFRAAAARRALTRLAREATAPAGHGVHRSDSSSSRGEAMNHRDTEAQRDRVAQVIPLHPGESTIARAEPARESFKAPLRAGAAPQYLRSSAFICGSKPSSRRSTLLASTAAFTSPLCVSVPLWFKATSSTAPAGHGVHRSVSSPPLGRRAAAG
jgi:hypothetical protein